MTQAIAAAVLLSILVLPAHALGTEPVVQQALPVSRPITSSGAAISQNTQPTVAQPKAPQPPKAVLRQAIARQSLMFVPAPGGESNAPFFAQGAGFSLSLERGGLTVHEQHPVLAKPGQKDESKSAASVDGYRSPKPAEFETSTVHVDFVGANPQVKIEGLDPVAAYANYFIGSDPSKWRTHVAEYSRVRYKNLYPGIDLVYYGRKGSQLEYDLVVSPGADPSLIRLRVADDQDIHLDEAGNLPLDGKDGSVRLGRPMLYQDIDHGKTAIAGSFVQVARNEFAFKAEKYDHTKPLIIDPTINLLYSTYAGGIHDDQALDMTLDAAGNAYLTGEAASQDFPVSGNAYQSVRKNIGSYVYNAVVMKFDSSGNLLFSTFLGGSSGDQGEGIRVDANGLVYVGGATSSSDFPVTSNAYQGTYGGGGDAFFVVLSNDGSQLVYSTFLGGPGSEGINRMQSDAKAGFWLAGSASGTGLPATSGAYQSASSGSAGFIAHVEFNAANAQPLKIDALTYLGGSTSSAGSDIYDLSFDPTGNVYITGSTSSTDYPVTANAYQNPSAFTLSGGCYNSPHPNTIATVSELAPDLKTLVYSTVLGGKTEDQNGYPICNQFGHTVHADGKGNIWVVGVTGMQDFPTTANALSTQLNGNGSAGVDLTVTELTPRTGSTTLTYSTYLGGSQFDYGDRAIWDANNNIWIIATSQSTDWPGIVQGTSLQPANAGGYDITLTELQPDGTKILYATYLGGSGDEDANLGRSTLAIDANSNLYLAGGTGSANYPATANAFQSAFANGDSGPDGYDFYYTVLGGGTIGTFGPLVGGNTGDTTLTVDGAGFASGATCSLVQGTTTIASTQATVNSAGTSITCTFGLNGATTGSYSVVVANPDGTSYTAASTFSVESGGQPIVAAAVIGRPKIRTGYPSTYDIIVSNSGTQDAYFTLVQVGFSGGIQLLSLGGGLTDPTDTTHFDYSQGSLITASNGYAYSELLVPFLAAGQSYSIPVQIEASADTSVFEVNAVAQVPWFTSASAAQASLAALNPAALPTACVTATPNASTDDCAGSYANYVGTAAASTTVSSTEPSPTQVNTVSASAASSFAAQFIALLGKMLNVQQGTASLSTLAAPLVTQPGASAVTSFQAVAEDYGSAAGLPSTTQVRRASAQRVSLVEDSRAKPASGPINALNCDVCGAWVLDSESQLACIYDLRILVYKQQCTASTTPGFTCIPVTNWWDVQEPCHNEQGQYCPAAQKYFFRGTNRLPSARSSDLASLLRLRPQNSSGGQGCAICSSSGSSVDPNYKAGTSGDSSASQYVNGFTPLHYEVGFENEATASLPAAQVVVTDQLDPTKVDLTKLTLGTISFGGNVINLPSGTSNYTTTYTPTSVKNYVVRIQGSLNSSTGLLKWTFQTIDPTTGLAPTDPTVGFLPPDTDGIVGQGSVLFNVMPLAGQTTGTQITNTANVVFDSNAAISTPSWLNTLDVNAPVSSVTALPSYEITTGTSGSFTVKWSGTDVGSGIASYTIYVSDNGGAYTAWQTAVTATSGSYTGTVGHTYGFYSIATDNVGNVQASKSTADTTTTVSNQVTTTALTASSTSAGSGTAVTFTATVTETSGSATPTGTVTFYDGTTSLGTGTLSSGIATYSTSSLAVGTHSITASYGGDASNSSSTSAAVSVVVGTPNFSLSLSPTAVSIASGGSGTTTITATPTFGFASAITFACSGLPAHATCTFSPATVTPSGGAASTTTLTIATNVVATASLRMDSPTVRPNERSPLLCIVLLGAFGLLRVRRRHRSFVKSRGERGFSLLAVLLLTLAGGVLMGCVGGSSTKTPAGTSTVTITGIGGSQTQTTVLSVTVQ